MDVEAVNDRLALEHPIDDYYEKSPWPIRFVESGGWGSSGTSSETRPGWRSPRSDRAEATCCGMFPKRG